MPESVERDIRRYVEALSTRVDAAVPRAPVEPAEAPNHRRGRLLMAAALVVLVGAVVAMLARPGGEAGDAPVATDPTRPSTTPPIGPEEGASTWRPVPGGGLDVVEHEPHAVWMLDDFFVLYLEHLGADPIGARIDPTTAEVTPVPSSPIGWRDAATVVWTGWEVLVLGGSSGVAIDPFGAAYDPTTDGWREISGPSEDVEESSADTLGDGVWNGTEVVYWQTGWAYDPAGDTWRGVAPAPLSERYGAAAVAIGEDVIVWGGCERVIDCYRAPETWLADGALYVAATGEWEPLPAGPLAPAPFHDAVSDGSSATLVSLPVEGRADGAVAARFTPRVGWAEIPAPPAAPRYGADLVQVGDAVVLGGPAYGGDQWLVLAAGGDRWEPIPRPATSRRFHVIADGGGHLLVAGGAAGGPPEVLPIDSAWDREVPATLEIPIGAELREGAPFLAFTVPDDLPPGTAYLAVVLDGRLRSRSSAGEGLGGSTHGTRLDADGTVTVEIVAEDVDMLPLARTEPVTLDVPSSGSAGSPGS